MQQGGHIKHKFNEAVVNDILIMSCDLFHEFSHFNLCKASSYTIGTCTQKFTAPLSYIHSHTNQMGFFSAEELINVIYVKSYFPLFCHGNAALVAIHTATVYISFGPTFHLTEV